MEIEQILLFSREFYIDSGGLAAWPGGWQLKRSISELEIEIILDNLLYDFLADCYYLRFEDLEYETFLTPGMSVEFAKQFK